MAVTQTTH